MKIIVEDVNKMSIGDQKSYYLVYGIKLAPGARVLISWQDDFLIELLKDRCADIQIDCLMDMDFAGFVQAPCSDKIMVYDYIIDNGLLAQTNMDAALLKAMGTHLVFCGLLRAVFPASMELDEVAGIAFENYFGDGRQLSFAEAGADSFFVVELFLFNQGVAWLQSFYTAEVRRKLVYLLQRVDFCLDVDAALESIWQLCHQNEITDEYLSVMVDIATVHKHQVKSLLALSQD